MKNAAIFTVMLLVSAVAVTNARPVTSQQLSAVDTPQHMDETAITLPDGSPFVFPIPLPVYPDYPVYRYGYGQGYGGHRDETLPFDPRNHNMLLPMMMMPQSRE